MRYSLSDSQFSTLELNIFVQDLNGDEGRKIDTNVKNRLRF